MSYVLGIDPGLATGMAVYDLDSCTVAHMEELQDGVKGFVGTFLNEVDIIYADKDLHLACEGFTLRSSNKFVANLKGVEIIGWLKGQGYAVNYPEPSQHMALVKKPLLTGMMQEAGFRIGAGHTRMALSVAVWYSAMILKHEPTLAMLKPKEVN